MIILDETSLQMLKENSDEVSHMNCSILNEGELGFYLTQ